MRSGSSLHDAGKADGTSDARFASAGSSGELGLPDPPAPESKMKWLGPAGSREEKQQRESNKNKKGWKVEPMFFGSSWTPLSTKKMTTPALKQP